MANDNIFKMQNELDEVNCIRKQQERQIDELQKALLMREEHLKKVKASIREKEDRIKFLEGQVDTYQYCLNCRR